MEQLGGTFRDALCECNVYVGRYSNLNIATLAQKYDIVCGNMSWFMRVCGQRLWVDASDNLLHCPLPKEGLPGFDEMVLQIGFNLQKLI